MNRLIWNRRAWALMSFGVFLSIAEPAHAAAPVAVAAPVPNAVTGQVVTLDGSQSSDPDGDTITFQWAFEEVPAESLLMNTDITGSTSAQAFFIPDVIGLYRLTLTVSDGLLSASADVDISVTLANVPPTADAGSRQTADVLTLVSLNGSASDDPDDFPNPTLTFQWTFAQVPPALGSLLSNTDIANATSEQASFTPDVIGLYRLTLTVSDGLLSASADVDINVTPVNLPPTAAAGPSQTAEVLTLVSLNGSASDDPDDFPNPTLTFQWRFAQLPPVPGSLLMNTDITGSTSAQASFTPDVIGLYPLRLTVSDGLLSASADVDINVTPVNLPPTAAAGPGQTAEVLTLVSLNGSASDDPDDLPNPTLTFQWGFAQVPPGSLLMNTDITGSTSAQASFTPDVIGLYRLTLTVSDGNLRDSDDVGINVTPAPADLELLSLTGTPAMLTVNGQLTYTITVTNNGPGPATSVQVVDSLPPGAELAEPVFSSQGECRRGSTDTVVCDLGMLADKAEATVTINVIPRMIGDLSNAAHVVNEVAAETDPDPANNSKTETTTVEPEDPAMADLAITAVADVGPTSASGQRRITYSLTVENLGPDTATGVQLTNDLPRGIALDPMAASPANCSGIDPVLCNLGTLPPSDEGVTVTIDVIREEDTDTLPNRAAVNADQHDSTPENNFALTSALDLPTDRPTPRTTCGSKRCKLKIRCNLSGLPDVLEGRCDNKVRLFVDTRARRNTRALRLSDARVARPLKVAFATTTVIRNFPGGLTNIEPLRLTRKGRKVARMLVQQGSKGLRGEMEITNAAGGTDIMRLWVRLK